MPDNKNFDKRKIKINEYLRNNMHPLTLDEMTDDLIVELELKTLHKRTVQEDIKFLKNSQNAPIKKRKIGKRTVWYYDDAKFSINEIPVDVDELLLLQKAVDIIAAMKTFSVSTNLQNIVWRLKQQRRLNYAATASFIQFETNENTAGYQYFDPIYEAIKDEAVLKITYQTFISDEQREFIIHPYLLKEYRNRWYVVCLIDEKKGITTFALDRINKLKNSSKPFKPNSSIDPEQYFQHVIGINRKQEDKPATIKIKVAPLQAAYFKTQPLHHTQKVIKTFKNGSVLMQYNLIVNLELRQLLLSFAGSINVIEPVGLGKEMEEMVKGIL
ncbi:YafY family protein [Ferruginibacter sp.]|uniref:helix-turn-helix transcriptional regulator n=1 Tax=Ferruginibacter sp. TaxID=1940288 RepID=UPI0019ACF5EB|nr:WYL domain-containing protein [Ferruginibacter sp.]MBC7629197.1 WYL domain-containing protein [Ferruginibacter sp.]